MALEPITRQEKIIAGQDLTPITRMEMFLKNFGGGGGGGSVDEAKTFLVKFEPDESGLVANKTYSEMLDAFNAGKILIGRGPSGITMCGSLGVSIDFVGFQCAYGTWIGTSISVSSDDVITFSSYQLTATQMVE